MTTWNGLDRWLEGTKAWVAAAPHGAGNPKGLEVSLKILRRHLADLGCVLESVEADGHPPLIVARREPQSSSRWIGLYGHYDVEKPGPGWDSDPFDVVVRDGRAYGCGIGDNLGPLALRLLALEEVAACPGIVWVVEGEEETGSTLARQSLRGDSFPEVELWLEETGYFFKDGDQRILALELAPNHRSAVENACRLAVEQGRKVRWEERRLHRLAGTGPEMVDAGKGYLAIGPNDDYTGIHKPNESLSLDLISLAAHQFRTLLESLAS